jgi:hypothetical protein
VETLYEILSPDASLRDYVEPYQQLAVLHQIVRTAFDVKGSPIKDLMNKTEELVREHVKADGLEEVLPVQEKRGEFLRVRCAPRPDQSTVRGCVVAPRSRNIG